jgi:hypothetical protein
MLGAAQRVLGCAVRGDVSPVRKAANWSVHFVLSAFALGRTRRCSPFQKHVPVTGHVNRQGLSDVHALSG